MKVIDLMRDIEILTPFMGKDKFPVRLKIQRGKRIATYTLAYVYDCEG